MSSDRHRPMWRRIAASSFGWFASIYVISAASVLLLTIHRHTSQYKETLLLLSKDAYDEYAASNGDVQTMLAPFRDTAEELGHGNVFLLITDPDGSPVLEVVSNPGIVKSMRDFVRSPNHTCRITGGDARKGVGSIAVRVRKTLLPDGRVLLIGINVTENEHVAIGIAIVLVAALLLSLVACFALSVFLARRFALPLARIVSAARDIASGNYSARVPTTSGETEIMELENAFNTMGEANERTLGELRRLTDDIAHDLRTPLARMKAAAELDALSGEDRGNLPQTVIEETSGMLEMINDALAVSRAEHLVDATPRDEIDLAVFLKRMADLYSTLAEDAEIAFSVNVPERPVVVMAHKGKLQQLVGNLLDNALKFTPRGGKVSVQLHESPPVVEVANTGPGIAEADIPHVFSRFWRGQKARTLPGNGLGLALVKAIAESYGASVRCSSSESGPTTFSVEFKQASTVRSFAVCEARRSAGIVSGS